VIRYVFRTILMAPSCFFWKICPIVVTDDIVSQFEPL
jgi:hypothetical protein